MYYLDKESFAFLDGYLQGLCVPIKAKEDVSIGCGILDVQNSDIKTTFYELFPSELTIKEYDQKQINIEFIEKEFANALSRLVNFVDNVYIDNLAFEVVDNLFNVIRTENDDDKNYFFGSEMYEVVLRFNEGGCNRYFIFPLGEKLVFILFRDFDRLQSLKDSAN